MKVNTFLLRVCVCSLVLACFFSVSNASSREGQQVLTSLEDEFPLPSSSSSSSSSSPSSSLQSGPREVDTATFQKKGRMVVLVNKNSLDDEQQPRNHAEESKKRSEQDVKEKKQEAQIEIGKEEAETKQKEEEKQKRLKREADIRKAEEAAKETARRKAEDEQKEKTRLQETEQKQKQAAQEAAEKEQQQKKVQEQQDKARQAEQAAKKEQADKAAAEQKQKDDPCFNPSRKHVPNAVIKTFDVNAFFNSIQEAGYPLDTGIFIKRGNALAVTASGSWSAAGDQLYSDANGLTQYGPYGYLGLTARFGSLVGRIGNGNYFFIGTDFFQCNVQDEGRLILMYWDSDSMNNKAAVTAKVSYTKVQQEDEPCFTKKINGAYVRTASVLARENSVSEAGVPLNTQAYIAQGTPLHITATGEWYASNDGGLYANPNGRAAQWNGLRFFSLVGRIGIGGWFFVGADFFTCQTNAEGFLQLGYWDVNSGDNRGVAQTTINYLRKNAAIESDCGGRSIAEGSTKSVRVYAKDNSVNGGSPLNTGVSVTAGKPLKITASGSWFAAFNNQLQSDPNGWNNLYNTYGVTLRFFSLVGRIDGNQYFFVGSDYYTCMAPNTGTLYLGYWDSNAFDNAGFVDANIRAA